MVDHQIVGRHVASAEGASPIADDRLEAKAANRMFLGAEYEWLAVVLIVLMVADVAEIVCFLLSLHFNYNT